MRTHITHSRYIRWREIALLLFLPGIAAMFVTLPVGSGAASVRPANPSGGATLTITATPTATRVSTSTPSPSPTHVPSCDAAWHQVTSPSTDLPFNSLLGIDGTSASDIWAVGASSNLGKGDITLTEHWDGASWTIVPSPSVTGQDSSLSGVWTSAPNDAWAVGFSLPTDATPLRTLTLHWDGTQWLIIPSPNPASGSGQLYDVDGTSASDIWAVGLVTLHWDGVQWNLVAMPTLPADATLFSVEALSASDVWAAGYSSDTTQTVTMHWDGTQWGHVPSPNPASGTGQLYSIAAIATNDLWAVGRYFPNPGSSEVRTLSMHWNGSQWAIVTTPNTGAADELQGVSAQSSNDVWAVGSSYDPQYGYRTLVLHWDGAQWNQVHAPNPTEFNVLSDVTTLPGGQIWAAGLTAIVNFPAVKYFTLIEQYSSTDFSDVPQGSTFYPYIKCLACLGVVSGYSDGTFRPNNALTRGQLAKIASESAEITDPIPTDRQTFQDVQVRDTFWLWIERLAGRGVVNGYPCGGVGEPCGPNSLPYYRSNNNVTRGQLSKIISNAAGFTDSIPAGRQTFEDVPQGSTFYTYTERLLLNRPGVMSGYPCGGAGEPCDPQSRPYFRPANNVTRGQSAKIASNTFFRNCDLLKDQR
jgi:hypothetical protein